MTGAEAALTLAVALVGGGQAWNWLASRGKAKVDLIELGQSIASATIKALQDDRSALMLEVRELKAEIAALGIKIDAQDDKIETLTTHIEKLETEVRRLGGTPPPRPLPKAKR
jgi:septal ring factor EnvC (AmiA/AmiB activator)